MSLSIPVNIGNIIKYFKKIDRIVNKPFKKISKKLNRKSNKKLNKKEINKTK